MNSYSFEIFGSYYILIFISLLIAFITFYSYKRTIPEISNSIRYFLMTLRFFGLFIILFLIFNPLLNIKTAEDINPKITYFIDNSQSMVYNYKDSTQLLNSINEILSTQENDEIYSFDKELIKNNIDSLNFNGNYTNLSSIFSKISSYKSSDNQIANVLVSDGNFNEGRNPLIDLNYIDKPIYVIGVGDTSKFIDISITSILLNNISYVNNLVPIEVNIASQEIDTGKVKAILFENSLALDTIEFNLFENQSNYNLNFEYIPKTIGDKRISVKIIPNFKEENTRNNTISDYIKILDDKRSIALFSSSPSPDISFLSTYLNSKDNFKLNKFIQKKSSTFYKSPSKKDFNESQILVLNNFPDRNTPNEVIIEIQEQLKKGKPLLFMFGPDVDFNKLNLIKDYLPFELISNNKNEFQVQANPTLESTGNAIMNFDVTNKLFWENLPTVFKTETFVKTKSTAKQLMNLKLNNNILNESFLISSEINDKKSVAIMAFGLYRWKMLGYAKEIALGNNPEIDFYNSFFDNIFKWLSVKEKEKQFVVNTNKKEYASGEDVQFSAQLYDNSYNIIDEAEIKIQLNSNKNKDKREIILTPIGNGKYKSNLSGLIPDSYSYSASAFYKGNKIGTENGIFNIGDIPVEYLKTTTNEALLKEIAEKSGGKYFHINSLKNINDVLKSDLEFESIPLFKSKDFVFRDNFWLLIIPVLLFSLEWFIRKRKGLL